MYTRASTLIFGFGLISTQINANPIGLIGPCFNMDPNVWTYEAHTTRENVPGDPVTGDFSCLGTGDCTLGAGIGFSKAVSVTIGADLSLDFAKIAGSAGISASVSVTEETGKTSTVEKHCPDGPWGCSLMISPSMTEVSGTRWKVTSTCMKIESSVEEYTLQYPDLRDGELQGAFVDLCTCHNMEHWADEGHYGRLCPQDCSAPPAEQ